jgi:hypothetical protein
MFILICRTVIARAKPEANQKYDKSIKHSCNAYTQGDENPTLPSLCGEGSGERSFRMK